MLVVFIFAFKRTLYTIVFLNFMHQFLNLKYGPSKLVDVIQLKYGKKEVFGKYL